MVKACVPILYIHGRMETWRNLAHSSTVAKSCQNDKWALLEEQMSRESETPARNCEGKTKKNRCVIVKRFKHNCIRHSSQLWNAPKYIEAVDKLQRSVLTAAAARTRAVRSVGDRVLRCRLRSHFQLSEFFSDLKRNMEIVTYRLRK